MYIKIKIVTITSLLLTVIVLVGQVSAHSGRTDSSGGHNCYVGACAGTYHYHNGGYTPSVYVPPRCVSSVGNSGNWEFKENNNCSQDVTITWDKGTNDELYSIAISKYAGADPGPNADTSERKFTFYDVKPGTWYVNIKAGSDSCNTSGVMYWKVVVPEPTSYFSASMGKTDNDLHLSGKCLKSVSSYPSIGTVSNLKSEVKELSFTKKTQIKLTGNPLYGKPIIQTVEYDPDRIIPTPTPKPTQAPKPEKKSCFLWWCW